jgi:ribosome biogenesis GTPase / thiamine phosphate phosphatase
LSSEPDLVRVLKQHRGHYEVTDNRLVTLSGALRHAGELPTVGDRVRVRDDVIVALEPRTSIVMRRGGQLLAANVDRMWIVVAQGHDFNVRRVERFVALAGAARVDPTVLVNKCDLGDPPLGELRTLGPPVLPISALTGAGVDALELRPGESTVLLGSSGAGKSTLVNRLAGSERLATGPVREHDQRGRHTTTHRELIELPNGGIVIDTPGMRVVGMTTSGGGAAFPDIEELAQGCRFGDCAHDGEPGCAVAGNVAPERLTAYRGLRQESAGERRRRAKTASRAQRQYYRLRR